MIEDAFENTRENFVLVGSDSDLLPLTLMNREAAGSSPAGRADMFSDRPACRR
jgi:hypothetical protein